MINIDEFLKDGLTKTDVAKRMELSRESLYRILSGNPTLDNLKKLANALGITLSELFMTDKKNISGFVKIGNEIREVNSVSDLREIYEEVCK